MKWVPDKFHNFWRKHFGTISFDDPRPIARENPYTFYLPPEDHIAALKSGDLVKLIFQGRPVSRAYNAEKMWASITNRIGDSFVGELENDPFDLPQISPGDVVRFNAFNIIDIDWDNTALKSRGLSKQPEKQIWDRCMVDDSVLDGSVKVGYLYREEPGMTQDGDKYPDSGWRIRGDVRNMTDEQYENGTASYIALGKVLNQDDSWLHLLDKPVGSAFLRNWKTGKFETTDRPET